MRLSKLTLSGFKSFADTTEFTFDHPVTGVVGPNGCGKSNIVDAIKWVLGERSSKSLRGTEMIDVIFAGSAARKPLGMASVSLTFENPVIEQAAPRIPGLPPSSLAAVAEVDGPAAEDGVNEPAPEVVADADDSGIISRGGRRRGLPVDADVVEVERRLYRDGASKYLINGRTARLRDIRELFLDTGIGADAYSIIEQGKVDAMLLASPQERRTIFEEAAGIAKYKQRRIESQRKLDKAETNLKSTREELESTDRRLKLVRGQAVKARKFKELDESLRAWRLALAFEQYDDLRTRLEGLTSRQADLGQVRDEAAKALLELEVAKQASELERHEAISAHKTVEQERLSATHLAQQATQRRAMLERAIEEAVRQAASDRARRDDLLQRAGQTETAITDQRECIAGFAEQLADAERALTEAAQQRAGVLESLNERRQNASQKLASANRIERERVGLVASAQGDLRRSEGVKEQVDRLSSKLARATEERQALTDGTEQTRAAMAATAELVSQTEAALQALESRLASLGADRTDRSSRASTLEQELARLDSRRATLQEMADSRAGFADAVRDVLEKRAAGKAFAGIIAPLADLIIATGHAEVATAIELALGDELQSLVVPDLQALPNADERKLLKGRVTFLPLSAPASELPNPGTLADLRLDDPNSRIVSLRSMVSARIEAPAEGSSDESAIQAKAAGINGLLDRLLGRTLLVEDADAAMMVLAGPLAAAGLGWRCVTRKGEIIDQSLRITIGPATVGDDSTGLLRQRAELESLSRQVGELALKLAAEREALRAVDAEAAGLTTEAGSQRSSLAQRQRQAFAEQSRLERLATDAARLDRERTAIDQELAQNRSRLDKLEKDRLETEQKAESLRRLYEEEAAAAAALEADCKESQVKADAISEQVTAAKVAVGTFSEQAGAARRELARLESSRDDLARQARDASTAVDRLDSRVLEHRTQINEAISAAEHAGAESQRLVSVVETAAAKVAETASRCEELGVSLHASRKRASELDRDWHSLEVSRREIEVKRETLEERTQQDLTLDLPLEYTEYRAMMEDGTVERIDVGVATAEIDVLRDAVRKLGSVNLESITEETLLAERNEELVRQVADLDAARVQLTDLITRLNEVSRARFSEVFTRIQENFGSQDGMFRKLFGGGKAEVRLMPLIREVENADGTISKVETEETDLLESGIEVIAKPPGKEPRSISQLSGGEKTLTAVGLLMSIFRSKPSCFCVLDEVDAALDEGNVARFNHAIRQFTDLSSFIVITHNKRTMQNTDRLYGVTMQERGVSTRVSVRFEDVGKNGEIKSGVGAGVGAGTTTEKAAAQKEPPLIEVSSTPVNVGTNN